jgi:RHS repeat-associated protein
MGSPYNTFAWTAHGPFGPIDYIWYGNAAGGFGGPIVRDYDYAISQIDLTDGGSTTLQNVSYTLDGANNVTAITDSVNAANSQTLGYDVINRLTSASSGTGGYGSLAWAYDKVGNLTSSTVGSTTTTYGLTSGSNKLSSITVGGGSPTTVSTNGNGNITSIPPAIGGSASTFAYNVANRLSGVSGGGSTTASYVYGAFGERVAKTVGGSTIVYGYGMDGELVEENYGATATDYISVEGWPVGMYVGGTASAGTGGTVYYVHPDAQGAPALVTDDSMATVWSANRQPYGTTGTISGSITQNLRLPGQSFDAETGFHQNGFRDYMPNLGRYLESDPIGLGGGMNTYAYVDGNPLKYMDPFGLVYQSHYDGTNGPPPGTIIVSPEQIQFVNAQFLTAIADPRLYLEKEQKDPYHYPATWKLNESLKTGCRFSLPATDNLPFRYLLQSQGLLIDSHGDTLSGIYEYIVVPGTDSGPPIMTHARFIVGGSITGYPNQKP